MLYARYVLLGVATFVMLVSEILLGKAGTATAQLLPFLLIAVGLGAVFFAGRLSSVPAVQTPQQCAMAICVAHIAVSLLLVVLFSTCTAGLHLAIMPGVHVGAGFAVAIALT